MCHYIVCCAALYISCSVRHVQNEHSTKYFVGTLSSSLKAQMFATATGKWIHEILDRRESSSLICLTFYCRRLDPFRIFLFFSLIEDWFHCWDKIRAKELRQKFSVKDLLSTKWSFSYWCTSNTWSNQWPLLHFLKHLLTQEQAAV